MDWEVGSQHGKNYGDIGHVKLRGGGVYVDENSWGEGGANVNSRLCARFERSWWG